MESTKIRVDGDSERTFNSGVKVGATVIALNDAAQILQRLHDRMSGQDGGFGLCHYGDAKIAKANAKMIASLETMRKIATEVHSLHTSVRFTHGDQ